MKTSYEKFLRILPVMLERHLFASINDGGRLQELSPWPIVHAELRPGQLWVCAPFPESDFDVRKVEFETVEVASEIPEECTWFVLYRGNTCVGGGSVGSESDQEGEKFATDIVLLKRAREDRTQIEFVRGVVKGLTGGDRKS
jgi:hypothetical protein